MTDVTTYRAAPPVAPLYARTVLGSLPRLGGRRARRDSLPDVEVRRLGVRTDPDHLASYARLTGHRLRDRLPGLYPHLAAFAPQLALITDRRFGFAAMGLVHVQHALVQHRPLSIGETYDLAVRPAGLRPHRSGRLVDLHTDVCVHGETVWEETMTLLARGNGDADATDASPLAAADAPTGETRWQVPADIGRAFAGVSGDRNPIHLSRLTARVFGFPRAIAHGMWTAARALAAVESTLPAAYRYDVAFRKPVLLPAEVRFGTVAAPVGCLLLGVVSADRRHQHLVGRVGSPA
ncbi:MaoC/PaaZ C-terminal domain-containing protein [soil metagenome]